MVVLVRVGVCVYYSVGSMRESVRRCVCVCVCVRVYVVLRIDVGRWKKGLV